MNYYVVLFTAAFVILAGLASWYEGTLTSGSVRHPHISFVGHGGMWADFFIFPWVIGLVWQYIEPSAKQLVIIGAISLALTLGMHALWGSDKKTVGHMWPTHAFGSWYKDLGLAGWLHVLFMTSVLTILLLFAISDVPEDTTLIVAILLTVFWPLGVIQPCWVITGRWIDPQAIGTSIGLLALTWGLTGWKLYFQT